jgi:GDPmannose 4,6-dehydratase
MMWKMLQLKKPEDFIISTGKEYSVRDFIELCSKQLGFLIEWKNKDFKEVGFVSKILDKKCKLKIGSIIVKVSKKYFRPTEVDFLKGNSNKAKKKLNWKPKYNIHLLIKDMLNNEYN